MKTRFRCPSMKANRSIATKSQNRRSKMNKVIHIFGVCWLAMAAAAVATGESSNPLQDNPELVGLDKDSFARFFGDLPKPQEHRDIRDEIESLRVFLDPKLSRDGLARAELRPTNKHHQRALTFPFGASDVTFYDTGAGPDRKSGDGLFTAAVPLNLSNELSSRTGGRDTLAAALDASTEFPTFHGREIVESEQETVVLRDPRVKRRLDSLLKITNDLEEMNDQAIVDALDLGPNEPIFEFTRKPNGVFDSRFVGLPSRLFAIVSPGSVDPAASLMITDVGVVEDPARTFDVCTGTGTPGGPWTFAHLMTEMSTGTGMSVEDFTLLWLNTWLLPQVANGFPVSDPGRAMQMQNRIITPWIAAGGGFPDVTRFPARLMAIVSRPDLADAIGYGSAGSGGEGRLVFGLLDPTTCSPMPFTVIFEYGIDVRGCLGLKSWYEQWKDLDNNGVGSAAYNAALEVITRQFTDHGTNPSQLPNQNSLAQLRTNENTLDPLWQLREFTLQSPSAVSPGTLGLVTVKQTPDFSFENSATLSNYIVANSVAILADRHVVPNRFPTLLDPFLGATSPTPSPNTFWRAPGVLAMPNGADLRQKVSLNTCSGCHAGETQTFFTHIGSVGRRFPGSSANLSGFLTGISIPDPGDPTITRNFNDLARRQQALADILNRTCFELPFFRPPTVMTH